MNQHIEVLIAIQARSNSTRFPKKIYETIGKKRVLEHVIDKAKSAATHVMRYPKDRNLRANVAVLHPTNDQELISTFQNTDCLFVGGPENDVLTRYVNAQAQTNADYIVRITSDCPLVLDFVIVKHINAAIFGRYDYVSNIEEKCRTVADGFDCEVLSAQALKWLHENALDADDREHVTPAIRRLRPKHLKQAFVASKLDTSDMKMSLDTPEDLERIRKYYHESEYKMDMAAKIFGKSNIYEL